MQRLKFYICTLFHLVLFITYTSCSPKEQTRFVEHLAFKDATSWSEDLCLPSGASDISVYEQISGTQDLERFYRFTVDPPDVKKAILEAISICDAKMGKKYQYENGTLSALVYNWPYWASAKIKWWKPDSISDGLYYITTESYGLRLWSDIEKGVIYVYQGD